MVIINITVLKIRTKIAKMRIFQANKIENGRMGEWERTQ
jgi:hypothetical protein